jgi:hypothetical protein
MRQPRKASDVPKIYMFESTTKTGLCAFAGDSTGSQLPERHGPWRTTGTVLPNHALPHRIKRDIVEKAIEGEGFQLWRMKQN